MKLYKQCEMCGSLTCTKTLCFPAETDPGQPNATVFVLYTLHRIEIFQTRPMLVTFHLCLPSRVRQPTPKHQPELEKVCILHAKAFVLAQDSFRLTEASFSSHSLRYSGRSRAHNLFRGRRKVWCKPLWRTLPQV